MMSPLILGIPVELKCFNYVTGSCQESCGQWQLVMSAFGTSRAELLRREMYLSRKRLEKEVNRIRKRQ
jgi:hypothetical protein